MQANHTIVISSLLALSVVGCAATAPKELVDARAAYDRVSHGKAGELAPADLHKAKTALDEAEKSFAEDGDEQATADRAYVALRKTQLAEVTASRAAESAVKEQAEQELKRAQAQKQAETSGALVTAQAALATSQQNLADAHAQTKAMEARLMNLATVKEEERGMVLTLSGSVLFPSNKATLLPAAETRLNDVSDALMSTKERSLIVEGYTDSRGRDDANLVLSQRRADAVRSYIVSRGYEADRIEARGMGNSRPIAENDSAEGRANNRRVEIVVQAAK
jgi:outer membrane protein OmpA-like peptidoglycan-associated protein